MLPFSQHFEREFTASEHCRESVVDEMFERGGALIVEFALFCEEAIEGCSEHFRRVQEYQIQGSWFRLEDNDNNRICDDAHIDRYFEPAILNQLLEDAAESASEEAFYG